MDSFDYLQMKPDASIVRHIGDGMQSQALVDEGSAYAIYLHVKLPRKVLKPADYLNKVDTRLGLELPAGRYQAEWVNTKTGVIDKHETFAHQGGTKELVTPTFVVDVALRLVRL